MFVGAGPGDPDLITVKGKKAVKEADLILYAGSLVPDAVLKWADSAAVRINTASLAFDEIIARMCEAHSRGQRVVRLHSGDPCLYGAIGEQIAELERRSVSYEVIPGVTAALAAAAAMGHEYTLPGVAQTLILTRMPGRTNVPEAESLKGLAAHKTSMAIYLSISMVREVAGILGEAYGDDAPAVVAYRVSRPDEEIIRTTIKDLPGVVRNKGITRQALIIVGKALKVRETGLRERSKLYDKKFSHGFREGTRQSPKARTSQYAIWAITPGGMTLARQVMKGLDGVDLHLSDRLAGDEVSGLQFKSLKVKLAESFNQYKGHIFIMATGIVVRMIVSLIRDKTVDPAVVVLDEKAGHCISLLAGHLGGANALARQIGEIVGAEPVITTATDVNDLPSIDLITKESEMIIENTDAIKIINMALLEEKRIEILDPYGLLKNALPVSTLTPAPASRLNGRCAGRGTNQPMIYVTDKIRAIASSCLILRPRILVAGIGCNRGTDRKEIETWLHDVFRKHQLSPKSLSALATIDIKKNEAGLIELAQTLDIPILFYSSEELNRTKGIKTPSSLVERHTGARSVCEAAALLGARTDQLLVPKECAKNVTMAVARTVSA
jgi:precorrin-4 C11-methyltransferase